MWAVLLHFLFLANQNLLIASSSILQLNKSVSHSMYVFYTEIVKLFINYFMCLSSGFFCFGNLFFMCPILPLNGSTTIIFVWYHYQSNLVRHKSFVGNSCFHDLFSVINITEFVLGGFKHFRVSNEKEKFQVQGASRDCFRCEVPLKTIPFLHFWPCLSVLTIQGCGSCFSARIA